jgi:hypothetical protein
MKNSLQLSLARVKTELLDSMPAPRQLDVPVDSPGEGSGSQHGLHRALPYAHVVVLDQVVSALRAGVDVVLIAAPARETGLRSSAGVGRDTEPPSANPEWAAAGDGYSPSRLPGDVLLTVSAEGFRVTVEHPDHLQLESPVAV